MRNPTELFTDKAQNEWIDKLIKMKKGKVTFICWNDIHIPETMCCVIYFHVFKNI